MKVDITKSNESFTDDKGVLVEYTQFWVVADKDTKIKIKVSKKDKGLLNYLCK